MSRELVVGGVYSHFKNPDNTYLVLNEALYLEDTSNLVKLGTAILESNRDYLVHVYVKDATIVYNYTDYKYDKQSNSKKCYSRIPKEGYTEEPLVIYEDLYSGDNVIYARETGIFLSKVDDKKYPEHAGKNRFELISK